MDDPYFKSLADQVVAMGFDRASAERALRANGGDVERSCMDLLDGKHQAPSAASAASAAATARLSAAEVAAVAEYEDEVALYRQGGEARQQWGPRGAPPWAGAGAHPGATYTPPSNPQGFRAESPGGHPGHAPPLEIPEMGRRAFSDAMSGGTASPDSPFPQEPPAGSGSGPAALLDEPPPPEPTLHHEVTAGSRPAFDLYAAMHGDEPDTHSQAAATLHELSNAALTGLIQQEQLEQLRGVLVNDGPEVAKQQMLQMAQGGGSGTPPRPPVRTGGGGGGTARGSPRQAATQGPIWEWNTGSKWVPFQSAHSRRLEEARQNGRRQLDLDIRGKGYSINLQTMIQRSKKVRARAALLACCAPCVTAVPFSREHVLRSLRDCRSFLFPHSLLTLLVTLRSP